MSLLLRGGQVLDHIRLTLESADLLVSGDRIGAVGPGLVPPAGARLLDARGCMVGLGTDGSTASDNQNMFESNQPLNRYAVPVGDSASGDGEMHGARPVASPLGTGDIGS